MGKNQRMYTPEFRQQMVELVRADRKYADLEKDSGSTGWSIRQWVDRELDRQDSKITNLVRQGAGPATM